MKSSKASKVPLFLDSQIIPKNRSYQSLTSTSCNSRIRQINNTIMNYVHKRLAEHQFNSNDIATPKQELLNKSIKKPINSKVFTNTNTFKSVNKRSLPPGNNHPIELKTKINTAGSQLTQRSKSNGHCKVTKLQQENKRLKNEIEAYQHQLSLLKLQMNSNKERHPQAGANYFFTHNNNNLNNEIDITINSLSISTLNDP